MLSATPRRPYVKYISQRERNWFEKIKKDNPDAIVIGIHNFVYVPEPSEKLGGKIKLQKGDTIAAIAGKNPAWLLGVPEIRGEVHANIEIPAVYRIPTRLEEKRRTLFEALKSRFRSFERIETEALLDEYLKTVDIKASREAGLMGEKMEEAIVEGIHEDILPKFLKGRRK
ncbi:hypothetical protein HY991_01345 [Candidatus Micrarchaeota archaeon]|nr:hypothetical protein [Candidatus Micrarchaeota archaeon]